MLWLRKRKSNIPRKTGQPGEEGSPSRDRLQRRSPSAGRSASDQRADGVTGKRVSVQQGWASNVRLKVSKARRGDKGALAVGLLAL